MRYLLLSLVFISSTACASSFHDGFHGALTEPSSSIYIDTSQGNHSDNNQQFIVIDTSTGQPHTIQPLGGGVYQQVN